MKKITIVLGTARKGRNSEAVATYLLEGFQMQQDVAATLVDVRDHVNAPVTVPPWGEGGADESPTPWKEIVSTTDAFVFVLPEYNRGYPGEWKLLVDQLYKEYAGKRAYIVGVSDGRFSGVRVGEHVKPVLFELGFILQKPSLYIGNADTAFDDDTKKRIAKFVETVAAISHVLEVAQVTKEK